MDDKLYAELNQEDMTEFHSRLLTHCRTRIDKSRSKMQTYFSGWRDRHNTYKSSRHQDKQDRKAVEEGRPAKQVLPLTYAKVNTFQSFVMSLFMQRPNVFELEPGGSEDKEYRELAEQLLTYDTRTSGFGRVLRQHVKDVAKFGVGVMKHSWEEEFVYVPQETVSDRTFFGIQWKSKPMTKMEKVVKRKGNKVRAVSPFEFLPDPRFPLTEVQRGEFCGDECDYSKDQLLQLDAEGVVAGAKFITALSADDAYKLKPSIFKSAINFDSPNETSNIVRLTEIQIRLTPSQFIMSDGKPLGPENTPTMFLVWMVNSSRIIRCEPMGYLHGEFTYEVAQYDEDSHEFVGQSLPEILDRLQETADWFMNARVESVTRTIDNQLIVDPLGVEMSTITNRSRVILLKKGAARTGVDRYVKQLTVQDVTARHMEDIAQIGQFMNTVSGVNENAMGQYHTGRRSATEARVVTQGAAARLKQIALSIWESSVAPTGAKMLLNLRQGLEAEDIIQVAGQCWAEPAKQNAVILFMSDAVSLARQTDFFVYDGTLASEKAYLAQTLKELFETAIGLGPQGLVQLDISPKLILESIYHLLGVGNISEFALSKDPQTLQNAVNQIVQQAIQQYAEQLQSSAVAGPTQQGPTQGAAE
jgi:hypothetical protein